jgi:hypothetical protein
MDPLPSPREASNVVLFRPREAASGPAAALAHAVDQLAALADTITRLDAAAAAGVPDDPLTEAAARAVARLRLDTLRIAEALQAAAPQPPRATSLQLHEEITDDAREIGR